MDIADLPEHFGMCFGVKDALALALDVARREPVTILGDLVHNDDVVAELEAAGAVRARRPEDVHTRSVVLTAHGTPQRIQLQLRTEGLVTHNGCLYAASNTCPHSRFQADG